MSRFFAHAHALFVEAAEAELRWHEPLVGGALEPDRGLGQILRYAAAFGKARRDLELGGRVASTAAARSAAADAGGQPVGRAVGRPAAGAAATLWARGGLQSGRADGARGLALGCRKRARRRRAVCC